MCMRDGRGAAREQRGGTHGDQGGGRGALRIGEEAAERAYALGGLGRDHTRPVSSPRRHTHQQSR